MSKWFICQEETVSGPFSTDEVKDQVHNGRIRHDYLIWGKPQQEWNSIEWWMRELPNILSAANPKKEEQLWHYALDGASVGPLKREDLVEELKAVTRLDDVLVWTKGMKSWVGLFEFHDLLDEMGINRRSHPRASIDGQVVLDVDGQTHIANLKTVSAGGLGADKVDQSLSIGQIVHVEIRSSAFGDPISANATVQYITGDGYAGFKFQGIHSEGKAKIIAYIKSQESAYAA